MSQTVLFQKSSKPQSPIILLQQPFNFWTSICYEPHRKKTSNIFKCSHLLVWKKIHTSWVMSCQKLSAFRWVGFMTFTTERPHALVRIFFGVKKHGFFWWGTKPPKFNTFAPEKWWVGRWFVCVWGESDVSWGELLNFGGIVLRICDDTWIWDLVMETNFWCLMIYAHIIESIYCLWRRAFQSNLYTLITNNSIGLLDAVQASVGHRGIHGEKTWLLMEEIRLTSLYIYIYIHVNFPLFTRFHTCQMVVSDCFHQQYKDFSKVAIFGES